jgi:hypothetical protein
MWVVIDPRAFASKPASPTHSVSCAITIDSAAIAAALLSVDVHWHDNPNGDAPSIP